MRSGPGSVSVASSSGPVFLSVDSLAQAGQGLSWVVSFIRVTLGQGKGQFPLACPQVPSDGVIKPATQG